MLLNQLGIGGLVQLHLESALKDYGWFKSYRLKQSVDAQGNPLPWYTYPFIAFIKTRIRPHFTVFEYGSGNSTIWYAARVASITAVEHDKKWYEMVLPRLPSGASIRYRDRGERYVQAVGETGDRYHLIVVDGRDRAKCALFAVNYLTEDGVIILDNSEREWYQAAKDGLALMGFRCLDFKGMAPIVGLETCTSVFYRNNNCLEI